LINVARAVCTMQATGDPYYLEVGKSVVENLDRLARVPCGFAAIKDVTAGTHEDQCVMFHCRLSLLHCVYSSTDMK